MLTSAAIIFNHSDTCAIPPERIPPAAVGKIIHKASEQGQELNFIGRKGINMILSMYF